MNRTIVRVALLAVAITTTPAAAQLPPRLPVSVDGVGEMTPAGCEAGAYKVPFAAASDAGDVWVVGRPVAIAAACEAIVYGTAAIFVGSWDPATGGCLADSTGSGARICIGAMPNRGVLNGVPFRYCPDAQRCFDGDAWLARA